MSKIGLVSVGIAAGLAGAVYVTARAINSSVEIPTTEALTQLIEARRRGSLLEQFDLSNPQVNVQHIVDGGPPKDGIPALTKPKKVSAASAIYPSPFDRVVEVVVGGAAIAYPLKILSRHEIVNDVVGGVPIAVVYCPLCDSVSVFERRIDDGEGGGGAMALEFGVSGKLLYSNVVMYERTTNALWSQVMMRAITGPHAGRALEHRPFRVTSFAAFKARHAKGRVLSPKTGHDRDYTVDPYAAYLASDSVFGQFEHGDALAPKTLGVGVAGEGFSIFRPADSIGVGETIAIETPAGSVRVSRSDDGLAVLGVPDGVAAMQTFFHSWSAFHPDTAVVGAVVGGPGDSKAAPATPKEPQG